jgi:hypothetical protein
MLHVTSFSYGGLGRASGRRDPGFLTAEHAQIAQKTERMVYVVWAATGLEDDK